MKEGPLLVYTNATEHHYLRREGVLLEYTTTELSIETSLTSRVELPSNSTYIIYSIRYRSARLPTIKEESPPLVNYLKKPKR